MFLFPATAWINSRENYKYWCVPERHEHIQTSIFMKQYKANGIEELNLKL